MDIENDFTEIYHIYSSKVYRLCLGYASGNEELAKEWQQETFVKVWKHRDSFQAKSSVGTWIYRIAVNICLNDLRKSKRLVRVKENLAETGPSEEENDERESKIKKMYECINKLTPMNKAIILLELEEVPQATIAKIQGMGQGALRTRLSRIRNSLLKCITNGK